MFNLLYNLMLWSPAVYVPTRRPPTEYEDVMGFQTDAFKSHRLSVAPDSSDRRRYLPFEEFVPRGQDRLILNSITPTNSALADFSGLGESMDAGAEVLDPLRRRGRKAAQKREQEVHEESLRHMAAMNRSAEREAEADADLSQIEVIKGKIAILRELNASGELSDEGLRKGIERFLGISNHIAEVFAEEEVRVLEVRDDETRG
ncbi:hypothetical protein [Nocardioides marmotae]|uniref:hypothetical protein n=1 Tax=Nocardioides marmotae TaxID=2663857 RepID=UPI0012B5670E|nr:hypothetical protein [Nocardioides marmotae]MBC9733557.1 hypothetical protein [Nocardioides marmotae]MTB84663.1 hypothetical protein [Nocardioides marmotae]